MKASSAESLIIERPFADLLGERYLSYALSTIMSRSLPDVRDGLKPVHRRLLYAMRQLKMSPSTPPRKSARVVGEVIGRFHPHGDVAVYDALVRLAQDFNLRYPLIEGQGNFGTLDGDNAAAMRYTEARLTDIAEALLDGIDEDTVDFRATYDGETQEPIVMPAAFPNLLANGSSGIAVGMATSIPPHNVGEICEALRHLIATPDAGLDKLAKLIPGPDFPTGGVLVEDRAAIVESYRTGHGSFRLRARWEVEQLARGAWQIVVTEIPWQVAKGRLIEQLADHITTRKLPLLDDVRDESTEDVRLILTPKSRTVEPTVLMESVFRASDLESRIPFNMNVLDAQGVPRVMDLKEVLRAFLDHRMEVLQRRSRHRLAALRARLEILAGYLIVYSHLDEVIRIIREEDEPKQALMQRFRLTENQAEAILEMRLRSLRRLEEKSLRDEKNRLDAESADIESLLTDEPRRWKKLDAEILATSEKYGKKTKLGKRRTQLAEAPAEVEIPEVIEREPVTVFCSEKGWIRAARGHIADISEIKYKEGDAARFALTCETPDKLLLLASDGRLYTLAVDKLPRGRGLGEPVRLMIDMAPDVDITALIRHEPGGKLLAASSDGRGFLVPADDVLAQTRVGKQVMNLADGARALWLIPARGDQVAVLGTNRKMAIFPLADLPEMARGRGVMLQKYAPGGGMRDLIVFALDKGLPIPGKADARETKLHLWQGARAATGHLAPPAIARSGFGVPGEKG